MVPPEIRPRSGSSDRRGSTGIFPLKSRGIGRILFPIPYFTPPNNSGGILENVIILGNAEESKAYQGLTEARTLHAQNRINLDSAIIVETDATGKLSIVDGVDNSVGRATAGGGLIGALVGVLGGPIGVLLGMSGGALIGAAVDADETDDGLTALSFLQGALAPSTTALLLVADEVDPTAVDGLATELGSTTTRYPAEDVLAEVEAAQAAQAQAERSARESVREQRKAERKAEREQKWADFKARF